MISQIGPPRRWQWLANNLSTHETWEGRRAPGVGCGSPKAERCIDARPGEVSPPKVLAGSPFYRVQCMYRRLALQHGKELWEVTVAVYHGSTMASAGLYQTDQETQWQTCLLRFMLASHTPATKGPLQPLGKHRRGSTVATHSTTKTTVYNRQHFPTSFSPPVVHTNMAVKCQAAATQAMTLRPPISIFVSMCGWMFSRVFTSVTATSNRAMCSIADPQTETQADYNIASGRYATRI